jgi:hypothetical protein
MCVKLASGVCSSGFKSIRCFVLNCWELLSTVGKLQQGASGQEEIVLFILLYTVLYILKICSIVVLGRFKLICPILPV